MSKKTEVPEDKVRVLARNIAEFLEYVDDVECDYLELPDAMIDKLIHCVPMGIILGQLDGLELTNVGGSLLDSIYLLLKQLPDDDNLFELIETIYSTFNNERDVHKERVAVRKEQRKKHKEVAAKLENIEVKNLGLRHERKVLDVYPGIGTLLTSLKEHLPLTANTINSRIKYMHTVHEQLESILLVVTNTRNEYPNMNAASEAILYTLATTVKRCIETESPQEVLLPIAAPEEVPAMAELMMFNGVCLVVLTSGLCLAPDVPHALTIGNFLNTRKEQLLSDDVELIGSRDHHKYGTILLINAKDNKNEIIINKGTAIGALYINDLSKNIVPDTELMHSIVDAYNTKVPA